MGKKLRFSFSQSRLDLLVKDLKSLNDDFRILSSQTSALLPTQTKSSSNKGRQHNHDIEKYRVIANASRQVYQALCRACTKHSEHVAHLCIEVEHKAQDNLPVPQVKFNLAFNSLALTGSSDQGDPIWFIIDTIIKDTEADSETKPVSEILDVTHSLKREAESPTEKLTKKLKKGVRFAPSTSAAPTGPLVAIYNALISNPRIRRDFCDYLRSCFRQPTQSDLCMGMLEKTDSCKHLLYPPRSQPLTGRAISLEQLISSVSQQVPSTSFPQYETLHLAKSLATAVLQYHATPWLKMSWRSHDIFFTRRIHHTYPKPSLKAPHLKVMIKEHNQALSQPSTIPARSIVRNPLLFNLGVMLREVAYCATLGRLEQPCDLDNGQRSALTEIFVARRLPPSLGREMGATYGNIVKKLLECDFGCGDDLNDPKLQAIFHREVVCALDKLEQGFRELQIGRQEE